MNKQLKINKGFFTAIISAFSDLDASIDQQFELRDKESQLLPLLYFNCLMLLLSQLIEVTSQVQEDPYLSVITAVIVSYLFFLPIFMYLLGFILHLILKMFGSVSSGFQTRLALFWSLSLSTLIILVVSISKIFISGTIELVIIVLSELIVVYIFSRIVSFVSNFKDRNLFTLIMTSLYFVPVILTNFSSGT
tara:strand:+ start:404 stop:979 length:576 start_codon:yes stop_codon:yes gene_type:complete